MNQACEQQITTQITIKLVICFFFVFHLIFFERHQFFFVIILIPVFWTSDDDQDRSLQLFALLPEHSGLFRFTSVTPANFVVVSMLVNPFTHLLLKQKCDSNLCSW